MALADIVLRKPRMRSVAVVDELTVVPKKPSSGTLFIPARDKVIAVDRSSDLNVQFRSPSRTNTMDLTIQVRLMFRQLRNVRPEYEYVGHHWANVFGPKTCYIFLDTKRRIKVALTRREINDLILKK